MTQTSRQVWTVEDGAAYFKCSERHFWQQYKDNKIPGFRVGNAIRFYSDEVIAAFEQQTKGETSD